MPENPWYMQADPKLHALLLCRCQKACFHIMDRRPVLPNTPNHRPQDSPCSPVKEQEPQLFHWEEESSNLHNKDLVWLVV
jgi:hypothetical protein